MFFREARRWDATFVLLDNEDLVQIVLNINNLVTKVLLGTSCLHALTQPCTVGSLARWLAGSLARCLAASLAYSLGASSLSWL